MNSSSVLIMFRQLSRGALGSPKDGSLNRGSRWDQQRGQVTDGPQPRRPVRFKSNMNINFL